MAPTGLSGEFCHIQAMSLAVDVCDAVWWTTMPIKAL
jgi:hypothetical protein